MLCCCRERSPNRSLPAQRKSKSPSPAAEKNGTGIPTATSESPLTTPETPLPITCNNNNSVSPDSVTLSVGTEEVDPKMAAELANLVSRLEAVTNRLESVAAHGGAGGAGAGDAGALAASVRAYDAQVKPDLDKFLSLCSQIGGDVDGQAGLVKKAFDAQRDIMIKASKCKMPPQDKLMDVFKPLSQQIEAIQGFMKDHRGSPFYMHLASVGECIPALGWVSVAPTPVPYIKEMLDAGTFYTNKVLKEYKEKDDAAKNLHTGWVRALQGVIKTLQDFVKQEHTTGLTWNAQGEDVSKVSAAAAPPPPPPAGGIPPPPPPGPPPPPAPVTSAPAGDGDSGETRAALFADINKGADITKGLKRVTDDMKTHKNPALRHGPQPFKPTISPKPVRSPTGAPPKTTPVKPPRTELDGKKWIVEYHHGNRNIIISDTNIKQAVYVFKCQDSTIQVKGKINSITLDNCKKTAIVFDDVISSLDFVNCQSVQAQVTGTVPTVSIDKTDGCMVYLSKSSINAVFVTAKSSEMNVLVPDESGEFKEFAVPEQFKTTFNGKRLVTQVSEIAG